MASVVELHLTLQRAMKKISKLVKVKLVQRTMLINQHTGIKASKWDAISLQAQSAIQKPWHGKAT